MTGADSRTIPLAQRVETAVRWLWPGFTWRSPTLWIIIVVNLALIGLYFWSRGGSTTDVQIEVRGDEYRVSVDGQELLAGVYTDAPEQGGVGVRLTTGNDVPSLPHPSGLDRIQVTDLDTGEVLFEDDFDGPLASVWQGARDNLVRDNGVLVPTAPAIVTTGPQPWDDYLLTATFKNLTEMSLYVRVVDDANAVLFHMRPYRHGNYSLALYRDGSQMEPLSGRYLAVDRGETMKSIVAMLLRPYPAMLLFIAVLIALASTVRVPRVQRLLSEAGGFVTRAAGRITIALVVGALLILGYLIRVVGDAIPKVPDSTLYVFQAKIFASFHLTADAPPVRDNFSIFKPYFLQIVDGRWFTHYDFGHPLFLSVGQLFDAPWVVPPILGALSVGLIYGIGKRVYGTAVGLIAAVLLLFSPFFQMTGSNFMSHNTAAFMILMILFLSTRPFKNHMLSMFVAGVFLGLLFNTRPLQSVAFMPVLGGFMGYQLLVSKERGQLIREDLAFAAGGALMLLAYFGYNQATTGDFLKSPYALQGAAGGDSFGFGGRHSLARGLQNQQVLLSLYVLAANGWPLAVGLGLAGLPFILGTRKSWDYFLAASAFVLAGANVLYVNPAIMHGPRFWYETMPFVILLTARGAWALKEAATAAGDQLARAFDWRPTVSGGSVAGFAVVSLVLALVAYSAWGWMLEQREAWRDIDFLPAQMSELEGFNHVDRRLLNEAKDMEIEDALIMVQPCAGWWCYGSEFWTNSTSLDSSIVWADRHDTQDDLTTIDFFADRDLYLADYQAGTIIRTTRAQIAAFVAEAEATRDQPASVTDTRTPEERDTIRRDDLERVRGVLFEYRDERGQFPTTGAQIQSLCRYRGDDGCALQDFTPQLPDDPFGNSQGYWYVSDGATFTLVAQQETLEPPLENECPAEILTRFDTLPILYCLDELAPGPGSN